MSISKSFPPFSLADHFKGQWSLEREITNALPSGQNYTMTGTVTFTAREDGSIGYLEEGELDLKNGKKPLETTRSYVYRQNGESFDIYFDDGRDKGKLFVSLDFEKDQDGVWVAHAQHFCPTYTDSTKCDIYDAFFKLLDQNHMFIVYEMKGPSESYATYSHLRRLSPGNI